MTIKAHSKFSASGAYRWFNCSGSVALSEGIPSKESKYSLEGVRAHEVLEELVLDAKEEGLEAIRYPLYRELARSHPKEMVEHAAHAANHILKIFSAAKGAELLVEEKVHLSFIHKEAFGTLDYAILDHFGTLHILDFKYGKYLVSPIENLQFLFYSLAVAYPYDWNFKRVRMWAMQPRIKNFDGYTFWDISIRELMKYIKDFKDAVKRVEERPDEYKEGDYCFFCPAIKICPIKKEAKLAKSTSIFEAHPITVTTKAKGKL